MEFILAILKTILDIFHGEMDGDGLLGSQEELPLKFTSSIKFTMEPQPPMQASGNYFPHDTARTNLPPIIQVYPKLKQMVLLMKICQCRVWYKQKI